MKRTIKKQSLTPTLLGALLIVAIPQTTKTMARIFGGPKLGSITKSSISPQDKKRIDAWLAEQKLNAYGDPEGVMYTGGTPLFDERTGFRVDRYDYLVKKFPKAPWKKQDSQSSSSSEEL